MSRWTSHVLVFCRVIAVAWVLGNLLGVPPLAADPTLAQSGVAGADEAGSLSSDRAVSRMVSGDQAVKEARRLSRTGDHAEALEQIQAGLAAEPEHLGLLLLNGNILLAINQCEAAQTAFKAYIAAGPRRGNARKIRETVRNLGVCRDTRLRVEVDQGPAQVFLDSPRQGVWCVADPVCEKGVLPRRYTVIIEREGYLADRQKVRIPRNRARKHPVTLTERPSRVVVDVVNGDPATEIWIDGQVKGASGFDGELAPGEHTVQIRRPGHEPYETTFTARLGRPVSLRDIALTERVEIAAIHPEIASVFLGDQEIAVQDGVFPLPEGCLSGCALTIRARGFQDREIEIPAEREPPHRIAPVTLEPIPEPAPEPVVDTRWSRRKTIAVAGSAGIVVTTAGLAVFEAIRARGARRDSVGGCREDGGPGLLCEPDGVAALERAHDRAHRADLFATASVMATLGVAVALSSDESAPAEGGLSRTRTVAIASSAVVAAVGLGVGVGYAIRARSFRDDARQFCDGDVGCSREGFVLDDEAASRTRFSTLGFAAAAAGSVGAMYLWLRAPESPRGAETIDHDVGGAPGREHQVEPVLAPGTIGVRLHGRF